MTEDNPLKPETEVNINKKDKKTAEEEAKTSFWKKHPILKAFLQALLILIVFLATGEGLVRYHLDKTRSASRAEGNTEFKPDPEIFWKLRPNLNMKMDMPKGGSFQVETNKQGIRNPEIPFKKPENGFRIECYGDSITYGHGVEGPETYESQLQKLLRTKYGASREVDVMNFGCPGYTAHQGWYLFKRLGVKYEPNLCILAFNYADPSAEEKKDIERIPKNPMVLNIQKFLYSSEFYLAMRQQKIDFDRQGKQPDQYYFTSVRVSLKEYEDFMRNWAAEMKKNDGHVIYLSLAMATPDPFSYYGDYRKVCSKVADETGNYFIDMDKVFKDSGLKNSELFLLSVREGEEVDRIHPNEKGFELMAKAIFELMEKENLIK